MKDSFDGTRRPWLLGLTALIAAAGIGGGAIWLTTNGPDQNTPPTSASSPTAPSPSSPPEQEETPEAVPPAPGVGDQLAAAEQHDTEDEDAAEVPTPEPVDPAAAAAIDNQARTAAEAWMREVVAWPKDLRDVNQPFLAWMFYLDNTSANLAEGAEMSVLEQRDLDRIMRDALGHLAFPKVVAVRDVTDAAAASGSGQVSMQVDVVFVNDGGWKRPGMHLTADLQITDGQVNVMVIHDGYVTEDPELIP